MSFHTNGLSHSKIKLFKTIESLTYTFSHVIWEH